MNSVSVAVITHFPSPYQVELFDQLAGEGSCNLAALYLHKQDHSRSWGLRPLRHRALFLDDAMDDAEAIVRHSDLVVFNYYQDRRVAKLMDLRIASRLPWCFWGERPGFRSRFLGRLLRHWKLHGLHRSRNPIWGIGEWAVEAYRREFGPVRSYVNLPYFSNLERFQAQRATWSEDNFTFLFSGSLSRRKGVDVLGHAFARLSREDPSVRMIIMGSGELEPRLREELEHCRDQVCWTGFKAWDELPAVYASAQALCVPSRHDGWGLVVVEGLATGLPVIATTHTGAAIDLVKDGRNGWLCRAEDTEAMYAAMKRARRLGRSAWEHMSTCAYLSIDEQTLPAGVRRFNAAVREALAASG